MMSLSFRRPAVIVIVIIIVVIMIRVGMVLALGGVRQGVMWHESGKQSCQRHAEPYRLPECHLSPPFAVSVGGSLWREV
jgi:hypothetical protein